MMLGLLPNPVPRWELASAAIVVKIRWFGLILGYVYVNLGPVQTDIWFINGILTLGFLYTLLDTHASWRGKVFLGRYPLAISFMEALFIGLLCYCEGDLNSPFRFYYLLSLICCAIRYSNLVTYVTCALDCLSYTCLYFALPSESNGLFTFFSLLVILIWVNWAASSMARLLKQYSQHVSELNSALRENQTLLEVRIEERTKELQQTQAQVMHQDKMAGFGLLAAGIAHEVGNPLTSISTLIQMLERRDLDSYTRDKLGLIAGQLHRIQGILRELVNFSRPASLERTRCSIPELIEEALNITKYYKATKNRSIQTEIDKDLPPLVAIRDQLVQVIFNLILNAIDATNKGGMIHIRAIRQEQVIVIEVEDDGCGIAMHQQASIFQPYFTTKKTGTGLGLFVTQKLIQEHGGTVSFTSQVGVGTRFQIELPIQSMSLTHSHSVVDSTFDSPFALGSNS